MWQGMGMSLQRPKVWDPPGAGVTGGSKAPNVDAWNRTQVL